MAGYNLIIKAESVEDAKLYADDYLSMPLDAAVDLGYNQIMATVVTDENLDATLNQWMADYNYPDGVAIGGLVWWKK